MGLKLFLEPLWLALDGPTAVRVTRISIIVIVIAIAAIIYLGLEAYIAIQERLDTISSSVTASISHISTAEIPELKNKRDAQVTTIETNIAHLIDVMAAMSVNIERQITVNDRQSDAIGKLAERTSNTEGQVESLRTYIYRQVGAHFEHHDPDIESPRHGQTPDPATPHVNGK